MWLFGQRRPNWKIIASSLGRYAYTGYQLPSCLLKVQNFEICVVTRKIQ